MKLILLRHGESQWNLENRFTGWKDVDLTSTGKEEAKFSAKQILKHKNDWHHLGFFEQSEWKTKFFGIDKERFKVVLWK